MFAQVVNSLILKVEDIAIFAAKISIFSRSWIGLPTQLCICNSHKSCKLRGGEEEGQGPLGGGGGELPMSNSHVISKNLRNVHVSFKGT